MIQDKLVSLRENERTAILLFSADLNELLNVSDAIAVMYSGEIVAYFDNLTKLNPQILGEYMLGIKRQSKEEIRGSIYEE